MLKKIPNYVSKFPHISFNVLSEYLQELVTLRVHLDVRLIVVVVNYVIHRSHYTITGNDVNELRSHVSSESYDARDVAGVPASEWCHCTT